LRASRKKINTFKVAALRALFELIPDPFSYEEKGNISPSLFKRGT